MIGAEGGSRTHTTLRSTNFKSYFGRFTSLSKRDIPILTGIVSRQSQLHPIRFDMRSRHPTEHSFIRQIEPITSYYQGSFDLLQEQR